MLGVRGRLYNRLVGEYREKFNRVVACVSHAFTAVEAKWKTIEQETFAIIWIVLFFPYGVVESAVHSRNGPSELDLY